MQVLQGIFGLIIMFYVVYTPTYLLFFNSAEDAAEKMSPISSIESFADIVSTYGNSREAGVIEGFAKNAKKMADEFDDKYKVDLFTPLFKQLKKDKNITDVKLNRPLKNFPRSAYEKELGEDAEIFSLISNGREGTTVSQLLSGSRAS